MTDTAFESVAGYQDDPLALPVSDLDAASKWYCNHFAMDEVERGEHPVPHVVLERDGVRIGFAINGGDASQDGAAIKVNNIDQMKADLESRGAPVSNSRIDQRDGQSFKVFFVTAPDGLCFYFHERLR